MEKRRSPWPLPVGLLIVLLALLRVAFSSPSRSPAPPLLGTILPERAPASIALPAPSAAPPSPSSPPTRQVRIWLDDFKPQPLQGESVYFFNRWEGDRGAVNNSRLAWGNGQVTTTVSAGTTWGGVWMSLNHPIRESLPINFSALLPSPILPAYQSRMTGINIVIRSGTAGRAFRVELKEGSNLRWQNEIVLNGGRQTMNSELPVLGNINQLVWVLDRASPGDYVVLESVSFTATTPITDTPTAAFVWSYGMLLNDWNPATGLVRDKSEDASGEFDAIQATGCLAAATAVAEQVGVIPHADAIRVVTRIGQTLMNDVPRLHGLWPHWVKQSGGKLTIIENTEWSSVDTVIAALALMRAQSALGLNSAGADNLLRGIEWDKLVTPGGISHGYAYDGKLIPYAWDVFGGESWLMELAYAGVTGRVAPMALPAPPTANGSGFIDELAWLLFAPPSGPDAWGTDWTAYRRLAADRQIAYYPTLAPSSCFSRLGLFGLSAGEVPAPSKVSPPSIYQAFGVGGRSNANDGSAVFGAPVVVPHYAAMIASLRPKEATRMWAWLIDQGFFTPLTNVESLSFPANSTCDPSEVSWNDLKGSWNLALQTLGWGRYVAEQRGLVPIFSNPGMTDYFVWGANKQLIPTSSAAAATPPLTSRASPLLTSIAPGAATPIPSSTPQVWAISRECENPNESTVGQTLSRSNALGGKVHGQFGAAVGSDWTAQPGEVGYYYLYTPPLDQLWLRLRYSKYSPSTVPILVYVDDEKTPRATLYPLDQGDWNRFTWTDSIPLGKVTDGAHWLKFSTVGQQFGVADLDEFVLTGLSPEMASPQVVETRRAVQVEQTRLVVVAPMKSPMPVVVTAIVTRTDKTIVWATPTPPAQKE